MAPPPAAAFQNAVDLIAPDDPAAHAVELLLIALTTADADRAVIATASIPLMMVGTCQCALMVGQLQLAPIQRIARCLLPPQYLEALEEIGATRFRLPAFVVAASYDAVGLTIEITRIRR